MVDFIMKNLLKVLGPKKFIKQSIWGTFPDLPESASLGLPFSWVGVQDDRTIGETGDWGSPRTLGIIFPSLVMVSLQVLRVISTHLKLPDVSGSVSNKQSVQDSLK